MGEFVLFLVSFSSVSGVGGTGAQGDGQSLLSGSHLQNFACHPESCEEVPRAILVLPRKERLQEVTSLRFLKCCRETRMTTEVQRTVHLQDLAEKKG